MPSAPTGARRDVAAPEARRSPTCIATSATGHSPPGPRSPAGLRGINLARAQSSLQEKVPFVNRRCFNNHRTESARRGLYGTLTQPRGPDIPLLYGFNFNLSSTTQPTHKTAGPPKQNQAYVPRCMGLRGKLKLSERLRGGPLKLPSLRSTTCAKHQSLTSTQGNPCSRTCMPCVLTWLAVLARKQSL